MSLSPSHSLNSQSFSASLPCSDYYSDTAYPAVISLITFKQLSVAFTPSVGLPLHSLPLIACSFLCQRLEGNIFHYLNNKRQILILQCMRFFLLQMDFFMRVGLNLGAGRCAAAWIARKIPKDTKTESHMSINMLCTAYLLIYRHNHASSK